MKNIFLAITFFITCFYTLQAQTKQKKALFVIVDGISADTKEKIKTPNLDAIAKAGGYSRAYVGGEKGGYSQTPTISAVGYNSLLTGTWVNKHNVWDNDIKDPNYNYWTIFRLLKDQYPQKQTAVFSSWLDNRTKLVGDGLPQTNHFRTDYFFDGMELDTLRFPHDKARDFMHQIDEKVVDEAAAYVAENGPDLSWVYLEYTDDMGHRYGDSEQFHKAVEMMDAQMGRLWRAIQLREKNFNEDWQIFITTDHGRDAKTGKGHGGQSDRERSTWIVTSAKNLNTVFKRGTGQTLLPGVVDIMPTIARHLGVTIPKAQSFEIDGVSLTGKLSLTNLIAKKEGGKVNLTWVSPDKEGKVKIWIATTNHFAKGGQDLYYLAGEVDAAAEKSQIDVSRYPSGFFKIVLEGKHNSVNRWIVE